MKKSHRDTIHLSKLAQAYHLTANYVKEEKIYAELITLPGIPPEYYFFYGEALKNNYKYAEAKIQYGKYLKMSPNNPTAMESIEACERIISGTDSLISIMVLNLNAVNTKFSDFSPFPYHKGMIITSDRKKNFIDNDKYEWTARPFLSIFYYPEIKTEDSVLAKPTMLQSPINDDYHNGPAWFYNDTTLYFTRVGKIKPKNKQAEVVNRAKIYYSYFNPEAAKKWWKKNTTVIYPFQYNSDDYSTGHVCFTPDGNYLFFSSDMPGGFGGKDIYVCIKQDSGWSKPKNLGSEVNSSGDELFPFAKSDKLIYFSSNGHSGHGGMDIFSTTRLTDSYWTLVKNLKSPINSSTDDFGIFFTGNNSGYFSSNRKGGKGNDDIYLFDIIRRNISGRMFNPVDSTPLVNRMIFLLNETGTFVDSTYTNEKGYFAFRNLKPDEVYSTKMAENDLGLAGYIDNTFNQEPLGIRVYITDAQRKIIDSLHLQSMEYFSYWRLKAHTYEAALAALIDIGMKNQNYIDFHGQIKMQSGSDSVPVSGISMILNSESGDMKKIVITDKDGKFRFDSIPNNQYYGLSIDEKDIPQNTDNMYYVTGKIFQSGTTDKPMTNARFYFSGKYNKKLRAVFTDNGGYFHFEFIPKDYYGVETMIADITDPMFVPLEAQPDSSFIVSMKKTALIDSSIIDISGNIYYNGDTLQPAANLVVLLKGETGNLIKKSTTDTVGGFRFRAIPNNQNYSVDIDEEVPGFNPNIRYLIIGNIDFHGEKIPVEKFKFYLGGRYDPKLIAMVTDKNGRFNLNYLPSEFYPISKVGEEDIKIADTGYVDISGKIFYNNNTSTPAVNIGVLLKGENGDIVKKTNTDIKGAYNFIKIPNNQTYTVMMDEESPKFKSNMMYLILGNIKYYGQDIPAEKFKLFLGGRYDNKLIEMVTDRNGSFRLNYLPIEHYPVAKLKEEDVKFSDKKNELQLVSTLSVLFDYDKTNITEGYEQNLHGLITIMKSDTSLRMEISAHTDSRGSDSYNLQLSKKRAETVKKYFVNKGVKLKYIRINPAGESQPVAPNNLPDGTDNPDGRKLNRRAEIKLIRYEIKSNSAEK